MNEPHLPPVPAAIAQTLNAIETADWAQASALCQAVLQQDPFHAEAHHLLAYVVGRQGDAPQALALLQRAVALNPLHPQYRYNLAVSLQEQGQENEAALHYRACLRQQPDHRDALWNYGEMLRMAEHFDLAAEHFLRFENGGGHYPALHHRLGVCLGVLGQEQAASERFQRELAQPDADALTHWEYALHLLSHEHFEQGFDHYRRRFTAGGRNSVYCHDFGLPAWDGQWRAGHTLLVHGEQGLGDEMMFASLLPRFLADARAADARVVLAVKPPLVRLLAQSFPGTPVLPHSPGLAPAPLTGLGPIHHQMAIGDLACRYRHNEADFTHGHTPYLRADSARTAHYRQLLQALEPPQAPQPRLRVGLMWGSNPAPVNHKFMRWAQQRSIPVALFEQLAHHLPDVRFVSLQNHERGAEAALAPRLDILDLSALQTDFAETAALIGALDLVISVDTSVSHLAGGMGTPCWTLLMKRADWRHGRYTREHSLWYRHTRYFRQTHSGDWPSVLKRVDTALTDLLNKRTQRDNALALAATHLHARNLPTARQHFEQALAHNPDDSAVQWEFAMQLLTEGDWARGWDYHEARLPVFGWEALNLCPLPWPLWQGEPLQGKTLLIHGEQGIGDEIMYASMLPDLLERGARIVLACVPCLVQLMRDAFPGITVVPHPRGQSALWHQRLPDWAHTIGPVDLQSPMGSLARHLRRAPQHFPRRAYLRADPQRIARMQEKLAPALAADPPGLLRVGVAWCGNLENPHGRAKSLTPEQLLPLAQVPGVRLIGLQSRQYATDAQRVPGLQLVDMSAHTDDFADLAALAVQMDLIISIDSSYVHLCGALGLPVWMPLRRNADWRWGWQQPDSIWYPDLTLFHQHTDGDWTPVLQALQTALQTRAATHQAQQTQKTQPTADH